MCRSKMATDAAKPTLPSRPKPSQQPPSPPQSTLRSSKRPFPPSQPSRSSELSTGEYTSTSSNFYYNSNNTFSSAGRAASPSSCTSLASLRESLPENPTLYDVSEIRSATNNFLARRYSASSSAPCWRCSLRGKDVLVSQRKVNRPTSLATVRDKLSFICKSHHVNIVKLLGASLSGDYIFLVYEFAPGSNLADCLRSPNNPSFTVLSTWMSRIKIAMDLANGLDYIHNSTGLSTRLVHNHIKSASVIVMEQSLNARICHFGTAILCGEPVEEEEEIEIDPSTNKAKIGEMSKEEEIGIAEHPRNLQRSNSVKFQGTRGYMSPEFQSSGIGTQKSDVYAFGVLILELLSGEDPVKYKYDRRRKEYVRMSVVDAAREAVEEEGRLRRWVDGRLRDSFPVEVVERLTRLALQCVQVEEDKRPNMRRVAGKISKLYLESQSWADRIQPPGDLTVSLGPR